MASTHIPTSFWLNDAQRAKVKAEAKAAGLSLSEYLRRKVLGENYRDETNAA